MKRTSHKGQRGFWMPVDGSPFEDENTGRSTLSVWMEYDADNHRFLGSIRLGRQPCHVEVCRVKRDAHGMYGVVADQETDAFIAAKVDGNWPCQTFSVAGFTGEWICVIDPFT